MTTAVAGTPMTAEEYARLPKPKDGTTLDLIRGEVVAVSRPNLEHGKIQGKAYLYIQLYLFENPIGEVVVESGVLVDRDPDTVRGPDVSYFSTARLPFDGRMNRYAEVVPDLCVEVLSPSNTRREIEEKLKEYFFNGTEMVWVIDPEFRCVTVYTEPLEGRVIKEGKDLTGGTVLPGFSCPVAKLFA